MTDKTEDRITALEELVGHRVCTTLMVIGARGNDLTEDEWNKRIGEAVNNAVEDFNKRDETQRQG